MTWQELRETAERVRGIPLEAVLERTGAEREACDKAKWRTKRGVLSVTGMRFMDWTVGRGGGGAIDLAMHVLGMDFKTAVRWLQEQLPGQVCHDEIARRAGRREVPRQVLREGCRELRLPAADEGQLSRVRKYLVRERALPGGLVEPLLAAGVVYADARANAVFLLLGKGRRAVGAELRGTTQRRWRGMAPGTRKDLGYFSVGAAARPGAGGGGADSGAIGGVDAAAGRCATVVLCESAIDAISCLALHPGRECISTSGARANPGWLSSLAKRDHEVYCGFDADPAGDEMARGMIALHPRVRRLRPPLHDWNDVLTSRR